MEDKLVIRFWPVENRFGYMASGWFGISLRAPVGFPRIPTMGSITTDHDFVSVDHYGGYASVIRFDTSNLQEGDYVEHEIFFIEEDGISIRPFSVIDLPLEVIVVGLGPAPSKAWPAFEWRGQEYSYAGGVLEVGAYQGGEYVTLVSSWVSGSSFPGKYDGGSWANPALPENSEKVWVDEDTGALWAELYGEFPVVPFWTGLKNAVEVGINAAPIPPEPEPEP